MNILWTWFLYRLKSWSSRQIRGSLVRQKVRGFKQKLATQIGQQN